MSYRELLGCKRPSCAGTLTIPVKLVIKGPKLIDVARCPECHRTYKFILSMGDKRQWLPLIGDTFFQCSICGTRSHLHIISRGSKFKANIKCENCEKKEAKVISRNLWLYGVGAISTRLSESNIIPPPPLESFSTLSQPPAPRTIPFPPKSVLGEKFLPTQPTKLEKFLLTADEKKLYTRLTFDYISNRLNIPVNQVMEVTENLILLGKLSARIDSLSNTLIFSEAMAQFESAQTTPIKLIPKQTPLEPTTPISTERMKSTPLAHEPPSREVELPLERVHTTSTERLESIRRSIDKIELIESPPEASTHSSEPETVLSQFETLVEESTSPSESISEEILSIPSSSAEEKALTQQISTEAIERAPHPAHVTRYHEKLRCKQPLCKNFGELTIPLKLFLKSNNITFDNVCLNCHMSNRGILPLSDKKTWLPLIAKTIFQCTRCGAINNDNYKYSIRFQRVRMEVRCKACEKKYNKRISIVVWNDLKTILKKPLLKPRPLPTEPSTPVVSEVELIPQISPSPIIEKSPNFSLIAEEVPLVPEPSEVKPLPRQRRRVARPPRGRPKIKLDKEFYDRLFLCKKCGKTQVAIQKIKFESTKRLETRAKCPNCGKSIHFTLPLSTINIWVHNLTQNFFRCTLCGTSCRIKNTQPRNEDVRVTLYCERDWLELHKDINAPLFQTLITQTQKIA